MTRAVKQTVLDAYAKSPVTAVLLALISSGALGGIGFDQFGGGAAARNNIHLVGDAAQKAVGDSQLLVVAANEERDRALASAHEMKTLYLECNTNLLHEIHPNHETE